jgi:hypothetical protein
VQLFGLVNTLLANARASAELDLAIQRYSVIPLSPNSGLIGWVPNCDTLHQLIREYRDQRKVGRRNGTHLDSALLNNMPRMGYSSPEGSCSEQKSTDQVDMLSALAAGALPRTPKLIGCRFANHPALPSTLLKKPDFTFQKGSMVPSVAASCIFSDSA